MGMDAITRDKCCTLSKQGLQNSSIVDAIMRIITYLNFIGPIA